MIPVFSRAAHPRGSTGRLVSADGTVHPIYTREQSVSLSAGYSSGMTGVGYQANHCCDGVSVPDTTTVYYHGDHLGSQRLITNTDGYPTWSATYLPFGQEWNPEITVNHYKFTGKERDAESGLDNFGARYDSSQYGRFMSPDPMGGHFVNPQSLNRYAYVHNNPLNMIDPTGLDCMYMMDNGVKAEGAVVGGDCISDNDNGVFVNGKINVSAGATLDSTNNTMSFYYTPDGATGSTLYHTSTPDPTSASYLDPGSTSYGFGGQNYATQVFSQAYQNSRAVTNPANIAGFYGASAVAGATGLAAASAMTASELAALASKLASLGPAAAQIAQQIYLNPGSWEAASDFIQGITPGAVPATVWGLAGALADKVVETYGPSIYNDLKGSVPH